jgi:hypothetical protein
MYLETPSLTVGSSHDSSHPYFFSPSSLSTKRLSASRSMAEKLREPIPTACLPCVRKVPCYVTSPYVQATTDPDLRVPVDLWAPLVRLQLTFRMLT